MHACAPRIRGVSAIAPPRSYPERQDEVLPDYGLRLRDMTVSSANFDPGVIVRALRFRANLHGFRLERGHYMDRPEDRADRWYAVPLGDSDPSRSGDGFRTIQEAADEAERLRKLREASIPDD